MSTSETWNRLPRLARGSVLILLGGSATFAVMTNTSDKPSPAPHRDHVSFPVGVGCAERPSSIVKTHTGDTFTLRCVNPDGSFGTVTALGELVRNHSTHPEGYDAVVDVISPDITSDSTVINFDFSNNDGKATIGIQSEVDPAINNSRLNGILRVVTNTPAGLTNRII